MAKLLLPPILSVGLLLLTVAAALSPPPPGPKECSSTQQKTCDGDCVNDFYYKNWIGDGVCDYGFSGVSLSNPYGGISFNCPDYDFDGGDCPNGANPGFNYNLDIPQPVASFDMDQTGGLIINQVDKNIFGVSHGTSFIYDPYIGRYALSCVESNKTYATISGVDYGLNGNFTIMFWFNNPDSVGSYFEYLYSHGSGPDNEGSVFEHDNIHIYIPDEDHPTVEGFVRTVVLGSDPEPGEEYYLDTDGQVIHTYINF